MIGLFSSKVVNGRVRCPRFSRGPAGEHPLDLLDLIGLERFFLADLAERSTRSLRLISTHWHAGIRTHRGRTRSSLYQSVSLKKKRALKLHALCSSMAGDSHESQSASEVDESINPRRLSTE